jgi:PKD repeat protein
VLTATDGTCSESDTVHITVNQFANSGEDKTICKGNSVAIGSSIGALPTGYSIAWSPALGLNNPNIDQPLASPNTSTIYTMSILDAANNVIEEDKVTVTILDSLTSGFSIEQTDLFEFSFINFTTIQSQSNTYAWSFGDGSTSSLINPNHTFVDYQKDTIYEICLVASNLCASDTFCDSLRIDSIGTASSTNMIAITQSSFFITDLDDRLTLAESLKINSEKVNMPTSITVRPNPFIRKTEIVINHDMSTYTQVAVVIYDFGGREILNYSLNKIEKTVKVDLSGKRHGTYYARLIADGQVLETVKLTLID